MYPTVTDHCDTFSGGNLTAEGRMQMRLQMQVR